jgi:hypothetical protein
MTLHRHKPGRGTDRLGDLIQHALCNSVGQAQPPAHVWKRIERKVQRRTTGQARRYANHTSDSYRPVTFGVWESHFPLLLFYVAGQPMPLLVRGGAGWAT